MDESLFLRQIALKPNAVLPDYTDKLPAVNSLRRHPIELRKPITFFVGENGSGKSTLLEAAAIAMGFNPEGGTLNFCFSTNDDYSALHTQLLLTKGISRPKGGFFLRAESFWNVAGYVDEIANEYPPILNQYGGVSLHEQSHGESFLALVENRFRGQGFYILDEPEAALSPSRILTLMCNIHELTEQGAQFLIATHSPMLIACPDSEVLELSDRGIDRVAYTETEQYRVTKEFLECPERMLHYLLE